MLRLILASFAFLTVDAAFRPPAIPLITTDPYFQSFIMGDNSTDGTVKHWDQRDKELAGLVRIDGETFHFLGDYSLGIEIVKPPEVHIGKDVSPGACDISNSDVDEETCGKLCSNHTNCQAYVMRDRCWLKSCSSPLVDQPSSTGVIVRRSKPSGLPSLEQVSVQVAPTRTLFHLRDPKSRVELNVTLLSTLFANDYVRLSRPVSYIIHEIRSLSGAEHDVQIYLDATAQWAVNDYKEQVTWDYVNSLAGARLGTEAQAVLGTKGDRTNINWGYLYLAPAAPSEDFKVWAGSSSKSRSAFVSDGKVPAEKDERMPRACNDDLPTLALVAKISSLASKSQRFSALLAYDDIKSVMYYNEGNFSGFWTRTWPDIKDAMIAAGGELSEMLDKSEKHDADLMQKLSAVGGQEYAQIGALAYRQTLAATKLVWNSKRGEMWNFLKEISTNGDMQTMDVVYPASPMLIYTNPALLKLLLIPVLAFANNETSTPFYNPFSPHEIGTYPIADHNTAQQEPMPMENTGNMFLMLAGIVKANGDDTSFFYPRYWPLLKSWADYLSDSLPFPANQLCTDDFTGRLANNTNLAAKGIVALEAFATLCESAKAGDCQKYRTSARGFAATWKQYAWEENHFKIAYNFTNSFSIKYNMVWQKLLGMDGPFDWDAIVPMEVKYYLSKANAFGTPMDSRHSYVKLDWLSWGATMADDDASFHALQDPIYKQAQATNCRVPLTDLFDTITATCSWGKYIFVDRPVVGGVFAKMLRARAESQPITKII